MNDLWLQKMRRMKVHKVVSRSDHTTISICESNLNSDGMKSNKKRQFCFEEF